MWLDYVVFLEIMNNYPGKVPGPPQNDADVNLFDRFSDPVPPTSTLD